MEDKPEIGAASDTEERVLEDLKEYLSDGLKIEGPFGLQSPLLFTPSNSNWTTPVTNFWSPVPHRRPAGSGVQRKHRTIRRNTCNDKLQIVSPTSVMQSASPTANHLEGLHLSPLDLTKCNKTGSPCEIPVTLQDRSQEEKTKCILEASRKISSAFEAFRVAGLQLQRNLKEEAAMKREKRKLELQVLRLRKEKLYLNMHRRRELKRNKGHIE
ncbi:hypothetical protein HPB51_024433 [Rhipicephalus microplus]|uniref:Uncharacterized protein n=1 Tax=Rhipicephalus microplus TaxID=6941 RepID=A0A9J6D7L5_RHIMP|nr:hypothetical protein HPB51_024433 [Rhipicephalus microplus]